MAADAVAPRRRATSSAARTSRTRRARHRRPVMLRPARRILQHSHRCWTSEVYDARRVAALRQRRAHDGAHRAPRGAAGRRQHKATRRKTRRRAGGLTVKYMLDFEGGGVRLCAPDARISRRAHCPGKDVKDARHLEEPWGAAPASALAARAAALRRRPRGDYHGRAEERLAAAAPRSLERPRRAPLQSRKLGARLAPSISRGGARSGTTSTWSGSSRWSMGTAATL